MEGKQTVAWLIQDIQSAPHHSIDLQLGWNLRAINLANQVWFSSLVVHLLGVELPEGFGAVLATRVEQNLLSSWVFSQKASHVVNTSIYDYPRLLVALLLRDFR